MTFSNKNMYAGCHDRANIVQTTRHKRLNDDCIDLNLFDFMGQGHDKLILMTASSAFSRRKVGRNNFFF